MHPQQNPRLANRAKKLALFQHGGSSHSLRREHSRKLRNPASRAALTVRSVSAIFENREGACRRKRGRGDGSVCRGSPGAHASGPAGARHGGSGKRRGRCRRPAPVRSPARHPESLHRGSEPMMLGSPTSPKTGVNAQFLPGFLMGDLPAPVTPQPRSISGPSVGVMEMRSPLLAGGSPPQPVVPAPKDKSGAPPVRSIYDDISSPGLGSTPLTSRRQTNISMMQSPLVGVTTPVTGQSMFSPANIGQPRKTTLSPAQLDPFYTQGDSLTSEDHLDDTWVTVFGFPQASASYILLQFAQYGNILKHVMSNTGNWMHIRYQSKLQARKALSKDGRIFGESIMIGVKPCIDKQFLYGLLWRGSLSRRSFPSPLQETAVKEEGGLQLHHCLSSIRKQSPPQHLYSFSAECLPKEAGVVYVRALALTPSAAYRKLTFDLNTLLD
ncbi:Nucleoporin NUP53 [Microtus ochrogaster]|uniref:Nucleoporin NUP35 n=1 Tax=Microtus ochrogaster TaxID=79684 RepID=A0A8J6GK20_MICOH|nr:Nucleoporin NUP53 [Microtus ochrogaster]